MRIRPLFLFAAALLGLASAQAEKPRITSQDQLPRFSYPLKGKVTDVVSTDAGYDLLAPAVRKDLEKLIHDYDIADKATLQGVLSVLMAMDVHEAKYDAALAKIAQIRGLEDKPAAKLTTGLLAESYIKTRRSGDFASEAAFQAAFQKNYAAALAALPWEVVADNIKSAKGSAEITSAALILGSLESSLQPGVDKTGTVSGDVANTLVSARTNVAHFLPLKAQRVAALTAYVQAHNKAKADIWAARNFDLPGSPQLHPVNVAVWDSGVDMAVFPATQRWTNTADPADGVDNDNNGYTDDTHGIAYDTKSNRVKELLMPLDAAQLAQYPTMRNHTKGLLDLQASIDSVEAGDLKKHLSSLKADQTKGFIENLNLFGNFTHGTHVAGIAAAGNPAARVMAVRITFDHRMIPDVPTREQSEKDAAAAREMIDYLKKTGVRVVNMSWGGTPKGIEAAFEANGAGGTPEERRKTSREYFQLFRDAMTEGIKSAPEILFVAAAGNSDSDATFDETVPSGIDLPNILTVGAVDQAGEETSFTSFGANVDVHANGFEVESYLPGGDRMKYSGTSMASPNVANLAAKLLAVEPRLTVAQVIDLIKQGAERSKDGRINLIHPRRSLELLRAWQKAN